MILDNTRVTPPWLLEIEGPSYMNTFLVKGVRVFRTPVDAPAPGVLNVDIAREFIYSAPSVIWAEGE